MDGLAADYFVERRIFFDPRLDHRLELTFDDMGRRPEGSLPRKLAKRGVLVGGYRMFNNPK